MATTRLALPTGIIPFSCPKENQELAGLLPELAGFIAGNRRFVVGTRRLLPEFAGSYDIEPRIDKIAPLQQDDLINRGA